MSVDSYLLDHDAFVRILREKKISQVSLASELRVSVKTIQRLVNRSTLRVRSEHLHEIATVLGVPKEALIKNQDVLSVRPRSEALTALSSSRVQDVMYLRGLWNEYLFILEDLQKQLNLPTDQKARLQGISAFVYAQLGNVRKADSGFARAMEFVELTGNERLKAEVLVLKEMVSVEFNRTEGDVSELSYLESLVPQMGSDLISKWYFAQGRRAFLLKDYDKSIVFLKKSICYAYQSAEASQYFLMNAYGYLGKIYFQQNYRQKSEVCWRRSQKKASLFGMSGRGPREDKKRSSLFSYEISRFDIEVVS